VTSNKRQKSSQSSSKIAISQVSQIQASNNPGRTPDSNASQQISQSQVTYIPGSTPDSDASKLSPNLETPSVAQKSSSSNHSIMRSTLPPTTGMSTADLPSNLFQVKSSHPSTFTMDLAPTPTRYATQHEEKEHIMKMYATKQYSYWIDGPHISLHLVDAIPRLYSDNLTDLILGKTRFCLKKGIINIQPSKDLQQELVTASTRSTTKSIIGSSYPYVSSSRFTFKEQDYSSNRQYPRIRETFDQFRQSMKSFLDNQEEVLLRTYQVEYPSIIWDSGIHPHFQKPHTDFNLQQFKNIEVDRYPIACIHAIHPFTILLFVRDEHHLAATYPIRICVQAGQSLFLAHDLWHSGDMCDFKDNERIHCYCVPDRYVVKKSYIPGDVYHDGRKDIIAADFKIISVHHSYFPNFQLMFQKIEEACLYHPPITAELREHRAFCLLILLWELLALSDPNDAATKNIRETSKLLYANTIQEVVANRYIDHEQYKYIKK